MFFRRAVLLFALSTASRCAASSPNYGEQTLIDPTNGTSVYGRIVNETRLVLRLDRSNFTDGDSWDGADAGIIYDLTIVDPPLESTESVVIWTPMIEYNKARQHVPFWVPGPQLGWTPFTVHPYLEVDLDTTLDEYVEHYGDYEDDWEANVGIVDSDVLDNEHGWNITRIVFINGEIYGEPGGLPQTNISMAAVYVMEAEDRPYEFVWWELVPLSWGMGWEDTVWFMNTDVPKGLQKKLLDDNPVTLDGAQISLSSK